MWEVENKYFCENTLSGNKQWFQLESIHPALISPNIVSV